MTDLTLKDIERLRGIAQAPIKFREASEEPWTKGIPLLTEFYAAFAPKTVLELLELAEKGLQVVEDEELEKQFEKLKP